MSREHVARVSDIPAGTMRGVEVGGRLLCVANIEGCGFRVIDDKCTHEDELLSDGELWGNEVECPAHGSRFSFLTGEVTGLPATRPTNVYKVGVEGDEVCVEL